MIGRSRPKLRQSEDALKASEQLYRTVVDHLARGVVVQDASGRIVTSNPAAREILGLEVDGLTGRTSFDPEWHAVWADGTPTRGEDHPATIARTTGQPVTGVVMGVRHSSGATRWLDVSARPLRDQSGDVVNGVVVTFLDVTDARRAEQAMRDSEALLNQAQELTKIGGWAYDVASGRVTWTAEVFRIHELPNDYDPNSRHRDIEFYAPEDRTRIAEALRLAVEVGRPYDLEARLVTDKGREIWVRTVGQPQLDDGRVVRVYGTIQDITDRKAGEAEVHRLKEELEQRVIARTAELEAANQELESFSYTVSHDLRAPLRAINGFAAILTRRHREALDEKGRHYVDRIVYASDRMGTLIEELLAYSRLGRYTVRAEPVPLGPLVSELRATFGERFAAAGGTFEVMEPLAVPAGDPMLLERILVNLVDNALTYRRPAVAPVVTLSATRHRRSVTLAVADNGIGIAPEYRERVFEVFARLHNDDEYPGTGIGLSIVRRAARLMGSDVTLESTEGSGTTFRLDLPASAEPRGDA